jgi:hypothetical protein
MQSGHLPLVSFLSASLLTESGRESCHAVGQHLSRPRIEGPVFNQISLCCLKEVFVEGLRNSVTYQPRASCRSRKVLSANATHIISEQVESIEHVQFGSSSTHSSCVTGTNSVPSVFFAASPSFPRPRWGGRNLRMSRR